MRTKEIKVGILAISGLALAYFGFNYLKGNSLLNKGKTYYSVYYNVNGLHVGSKVIVNGFPVGKVKDLTILPERQNMVLAEYIVIDETIQLSKDSKAEILSIDLFGSKAINLIMGNSREMTSKGDTLAGVEAKGMLDEVNDRIMPYEDKLQVIIANVDTVLEGVKVTIASLNSLIEAEKGKVGEITENAVAISQNLEDNSKNINNTLTNLSNLSDSLSQADIKQILDNANKALNDMAQAMEKINNGSGTMGKLVNDSSLYVNLNQSAMDLDILLKDLKENPKRYVQVKASLFGGKDKSEDEK